MLGDEYSLLFNDGVEKMAISVLLEFNIGYNNLDLDLLDTKGSCTNTNIMYP